MGTKFKNRVLRFLFIFCVSIPLYVLPIHFFSSKGMGPQSWEQLWDDKWVYIEIDFYLSTLYTFINDDKEPFWEKLKKKGKKKINEN